MGEVLSLVVDLCSRPQWVIRWDAKYVVEVTCLRHIAFFPVFAYLFICQANKFFLEITEVDI